MEPAVPRSGCEARPQSLGPGVLIARPRIARAAAARDAVRVAADRDDANANVVYRAPMWNINIKGTKAEVAKKLTEAKAPEDAAAAAQFKNAVAFVATHVAAYADVDPTKDRQVEVIAYGAVGQPAGSRSLSIKIEG